MLSWMEGTGIDEIFAPRVKDVKKEMWLLLKVSFHHRVNAFMDFVHLNLTIREVDLTKL